MAHTSPVQRRLAAILAADIVGYSGLMGADDEGTLERLKAVRAELVDPIIAQHRGRIFKTMGDGLLVEFGSAVDAMRCAITVQRGMDERNAPTPAEGRITFRIGINVGDVIIDGDDIYGDGVNIAARLEALAKPGGICVSARVYEDTVSRVDTAFEDLGEQALKNISRSVRVYQVQAASEATASRITIRHQVTRRTRSLPLRHQRRNKLYCDASAFSGGGAASGTQRI